MVRDEKAGVLYIVKLWLISNLLQKRLSENMYIGICGNIDIFTFSFCQVRIFFSRPFDLFDI
jgi:hypothetical protein